MKNPEKEWFGNERVSASEKTQKVLGVFESVASRYDIMNDLMSGGVHRLWKDRLIRMIRPKAHERFLDVAGGTGDIAFRLKDATPPETEITISDINPEMLAEGQRRAIDKGYHGQFDWVEANAEKLPFKANSFDVYTIAFGLRNVTHIDKALADAYRVLKPGGRFFCLEFSHVKDPFLAKVYDIYSEKVIPRIGKVVAKDADSYQYLVESIRKFPRPKDLATRMEQVGFENVSYKAMSLGIVCVHIGYKF